MGAAETALCTVRPVRGDGADQQDRSAGPSVDAELSHYVRTAAHDAELEQIPAFAAYLKQVEGYPQLSAGAQAELVAAYQHAQQLRTQLAAGELRGRAAAKARIAIRDGDRNLETVVASNFRLVLTIAKELVIHKYGTQRGLELLPDMVSEGNVALTEAVQTFDAELSPSFPTYAARSIRDRVRASLVRQGSIRLPPSWSRTQSIAQARQAKLTAQNGVAPTLDELRADVLAVCLEWAESKLTPTQRELDPDGQREAKLAKLRKQGTLGAIEKLDQVLAAPSPTQMASLDEPVGAENGAATRKDFLADDPDDSAFEGVEREELRQALQLALSHLNDRERRILLCRYGFVDGERWTYSKIAEEFDVTAERIRQIERATLKRMSAPHAQWSHLGSFLPSHTDNP